MEKVGSFICFVVSGYSSQSKLGLSKLFSLPLRREHNLGPQTGSPSLERVYKVCLILSFVYGFPGLWVWVIDFKTIVYLLVLLFSKFGNVPPNTSLHHLCMFWSISVTPLTALSGLFRTAVCEALFLFIRLSGLVFFMRALLVLFIS